jgi:hypothetical protein
MKILLRICLAIVLVLAPSGHCLADMGIQEVPREEAKIMGVAIRSQPNGEEGVTVWLEFKPQGALKAFSWVRFSINAGGKHLVSAPLMNSRPGTDQVAVYFSADRSLLAGSSFLIAVADVPLGGSGYLLKVKNFIELEKSK